MYGPFNFPKNMHPISPILWLCFKEINAELKKPLQIILPHTLTRLSRAKAAYYKEFISFAKANHDNFTMDKSGQIYYNFSSQAVDGNTIFEFGARSYGILQTTHCCFICLQKSIKLHEGTGYSLARIQLKQIQSGLSTLQEFHFYATFDLPTCRKALERQLKKKGLCDFSTVYTLFTFASQAGPVLRICTPKNHNRSFTVALEPENGEIMASKIDFWKFGFEMMKDYHKKFLYPPSLKMKVFVTGSDSVIFPLRFEDCTIDSQLNADLVIIPTVPSQINLKLQTQSQLTHKKGCLTLNNLSVVQLSVWEARAKWFNLGVQLNVNPTSLVAIQEKNNRDTDACMNEMLITWLNQSNPSWPPTWSSLVAALKQPTVGLGQLADNIEREHLKYTSNGSEKSHSSTVSLGKHPHQSSGEPSVTLVSDDGTAIKKQKVESESVEHGSEVELESASTASMLGKHHNIQHSDDEGPDIKRQKPS